LLSRPAISVLTPCSLERVAFEFVTRRKRLGVERQPRGRVPVVVMAGINTTVRVDAAASPTAPVHRRLRPHRRRRYGRGQSHVTSLLRRRNIFARGDAEPRTFESLAGATGRSPVSLAHRDSSQQSGSSTARATCRSPLHSSPRLCVSACKTFMLASIVAKRDYPGYGRWPPRPQRTAALISSREIPMSVKR
jgi:hypothetical protein